MAPTKRPCPHSAPVRETTPLRPATNVFWDSPPLATPLRLLWSRQYAKVQKSKTKPKPPPRKLNWLPFCVITLEDQIRSPMHMSKIDNKNPPENAMLSVKYGNQMRCTQRKTRYCLELTAIRNELGASSGRQLWSRVEASSSSLLTRGFFKTQVQLPFAASSLSLINAWTSPLCRRVKASEFQRTDIKRHPVD